jgi:serine/threonine protein kinase/tetratricopeptide (TPR) repeat protein
MLGQVFGHFRVVERIGAGGMGVVYLAHDQHLDRPVALKVLPTVSPADAAPRRRFRQEALALSRLNHPNIAVVHDFDTFGDVDVLVMEYVPGMTLSDRLHSGALPEAEVLSIGVQLAAGLEAAHAQGIVHRDLKPGNLRVTPEGRLKILDFGLARLFEGDEGLTTQTDTDLARPPGTLAYMAPELLRGQAPMPATDIYAAGVTLYELATGAAPFSGSRAHVIESILNEQPEPPRSRSRQISDGLDGAILKAIDKRPDRRYQTARELRVDLQRCAEPSSGAPAPSRRTVTRRRALVAGTAALAAGAAWWRFGPSSGVSAAFPPRGWAVVADFENRSRDTQIDRLVQESLVLALQQSSYVNVFSRDRLFEAMRRMRRPDGERVSEAVALDVCRRENAQLLLAGVIEQSGEAMRVTVRALSPSGDLLFAEVAELGTRDEFFGRVDDLARRVRRRLGETLERIQQASEPLDKVTTRSFDALRLYTQAVDRLARGQIQDAQPLLQAALTLDPQFAMAHRQLARVFQTVGEREQSLAHFERAFELRVAVTPRERYVIEAANHGAHERYNDAVESLSLLTALFPDDLDAQYELATARSAIGEIERAIQATREVLRIEPRSPKANELLVLLLARNNQEQDALDEARRASGAIGETPRLRWGRALALMGQRRLAEASDELRAMEKESSGYQGISRLYLSRIALLEGRLDDASDELARDLDDDHRAGRGSAELLRRYLVARVHLLRGAASAAREQALLIVAAPAVVAKATNLRQAAEVLLQTGDAAAARAVLARLEAVAIEAPSSFTRSCVHHVNGMLALADGQAEPALAAFRRADAEYRSYLSHRGMARAFELGRQWIEVAREWREVLDARGEVLRDGFSPDLVEAELELGYAYVRLNQPAKARELYQHVLEAWRLGAGEKLARDATQALGRLTGGDAGVR